MMNVDRYPLNNNQKPELQPLAKPLPFTASNTTDPAQPKTVGSLRGDRFKPLSVAEMTPRQKALFELLESGKIEGGTGGPVNVLLRSPDLGEAILRYGAYERFHTPLPAKLTETARLLSYRLWARQ